MKQQITDGLGAGFFIKCDLCGEYLPCDDGNPNIISSDDEIILLCDESYWVTDGNEHYCCWCNGAVDTFDCFG